jgi:hypothetical protein
MSIYLQIDGTNVRIAGSMHFVPAEHAALPSWIAQAYEWSDQLALEIDNNLSDMKLLSSLPGDETVADKLPPHLFAKLISAWPDRHRFGAVRKQKLWVITALLPMLNIQFAPGVEPYLASRAGADRKATFFLETPKEFSDLADSVDDARFIHLIEVALNSLPQYEQLLRDMHAAWLSQRLHAFDAILPRSLLALDPVVWSAALDQRNQAWLPKVLSALPQRERTLIVVGALHLAAPNGLPALLEKQGYSLSPVVG